MPNRKKLTRKKSKQRGGKRVNKKTESKKRKKISNQLKPENIGKILSNIHILLSFPSIEFLPSTNIFSKNNTGHYLQMIDYQDLANIINQNPKYKKSPTIQNIFNYQSYNLENENEIIFNYKNIQCDNLIMKELIIAFGLFLFIEGILYALFPSKMKNMLKKLDMIKDSQLRSGGMIFAVIGFLIVWYVKN